MIRQRQNRIRIRIRLLGKLASVRLMFYPCDFTKCHENDCASVGTRREDDENFPHARSVAHHISPLPPEDDHAQTNPIVNLKAARAAAIELPASVLAST